MRVQATSVAELLPLVREKLDFLKTSRPTAVNLAEATERVWTALQFWHADDTTLDVADARSKLVVEIESMLPIDITTNRNIGAHGGDFLLARVRQ